MKIAKYFEGKEVLVSGATGLMGKAIVEKLLRCCPGVSKIYVIIRPKRGCQPEERWEATTNSRLFNVLKETSPDALSKVVVVPGDGAEDEFGLSKEDQAMLIENVNVVYHGAASINFFNDITRALEMNLKSTYSLLELSRKMKKLECFTHTSTSYCHFAVKGEIKEEVYRSHLDWKVMLELIKNENHCDVLRVLEPALMSGHLSTYTLSKAMAENAVEEYKKYFPVVIIRPALVIGIAKDPIPGWMDVDNFLSLYCKGVRMGVLRVAPNRKTLPIEGVPLDMSVRGILVSTWKRSVYPTQEAEVYCHRIEGDVRITVEDHGNIGMALSEKYPSPNTLWYNYCLHSGNLLVYYTLFMLLHVISGMIIDLALKLSGQKTRMKKIYSYIWMYTPLSQYYENPHHWFSSEKFNQLKSFVPEEDMNDFNIDYSDIDKYLMFRDLSLSVIQYTWKEPIDDEELMEKSRKRYRMLMVLHYTVCTLLGLLLLKVGWSTAISAGSWWAIRK